MLDQPNARVTVCEVIPLSVAVVDGKVGVNLTDEQGVLKGGLVCEDEIVHEWGLDLLEQCRENGSTVDSSTISQD